MKHLIPIALFLSISILADAQGPTLTSANVSPAVGDAFTNQTAKSTGVSVGTGGANQVWDYSTLVDSSTASGYTVVSPASTPHPTAFADANLSLVTVEANPIYQYGKSSSDALYVLGIISGTDTITYIRPKVYLHYPFAYNGFFTDTVAVTVPGYDAIARGRDSLYGEGYGTLKLPGGHSYNDVLRVKYIENLSTIVNYDLGGGFIIPVTLKQRSISYVYYTPGARSPLLSIAVTSITNSLNIPIPNFSGESTSVYYAKETTLPLTWLSFTSILQDHQVALKWQTAQEINTGVFNVQRSVNGSDFTNIGQLKATGNNMGGSYTYNDLNVEKLGSPKLYYRIQELDKDGKAFYTGINVIELKNVLTTKVYPNPANGFINLNIKDAAVADAVRIYDLKGRLVQTWKDYPTNRLINVKNLTSGSYILQVQVKGKTTSTTIVKQ